MQFTRYLKYTLPMLKGEDVLFLQIKLLRLGYHQVGTPDGKFGASTDQALRAFQRDRNLTVDGIVGPNTWKALFTEAEEDPAQTLKSVLKEVAEFHRYKDSTRWRLQKKGVELEGGKIPRTAGQPNTVKRVWEKFGHPIEKWSEKFGVPAELIVATICTESSGNPNALRKEPHYVSDEATPNKISPGLMQTLISTAREALRDPTIDRAWLLEPANSIQAGTAYIAAQWKSTHFDPPKVGCAYNAGGIYYNSAEANHWKMRQYPIGTPHHADRFVEWFNDFYFVMKSENIAVKVTFFDKL